MSLSAQCRSSGGCAIFERQIATRVGGRALRWRAIGFEKTCHLRDSKRTIGYAPIFGGSSDLDCSLKAAAGSVGAAVSIIGRQSPMHIGYHTQSPGLRGVGSSRITSAPGRPKDSQRSTGLRRLYTRATAAPLSRWVGNDGKVSPRCDSRRASWAEAARMVLGDQAGVGLSFAYDYASSGDRAIEGA